MLFQYQMPIGFRRELAAVRHAQLRLAREKAILEDSELDVSHGLATPCETSKPTSSFRRPTPTAGPPPSGSRGPRSTLSRRPRRRSTTCSKLSAAGPSPKAPSGRPSSNTTSRSPTCTPARARSWTTTASPLHEGPWPQKAYWDALATALASVTPACTSITAGRGRKSSAAGRSAGRDRRRPDGGRSRRGHDRRAAVARADAGSAACRRQCDGQSRSRSQPVVPTGTSRQPAQPARQTALSRALSRR